MGIIKVHRNPVTFKTQNACRCFVKVVIAQADSNQTDHNINIDNFVMK